MNDKTKRTVLWMVLLVATGSGFSQTLDEVQSAAEQGHVEAQYRLGLMYHNKDEEKAFYNGNHEAACEALKELKN